MEKNQDAYGAQLLAQYYHKGEETYEIIEREDGYIGSGSEAGDYFKDYPHWSRPEQTGIKLAKGGVLDVGSGAGRHSLWLQRHGHKVTSIDNSPGAIKVCKLRGVKDARVLPIEKIGTFKPGAFDTIIMFGNNFGLMSDFRKAKNLLKKMHRITSTDARILAETRDPYRTNVKAHLDYHKFNRRRGRMAGQIRMRVRFENIIGPWFDYLFVSKSEMEGIIEQTDWRIERFITEPKSANYIAVLRKRI
jgi:SAM-dependent methyltransferase